MIVRSRELYDRALVDDVERCLVQMERNGFALDVDFCNEQAAKAREQEADCLETLKKWTLEHGTVPINWASHVQLVSLIHGHFGLPPSPVWKKGRVKVDDGERKIDETALDWLREHAPAKIASGLDELIRLRRLRGAIKYLSKLPTCVAPDGLVHPVSGPSGDFDSRAGTITWRLACKNPEIQQIPNDKKKDWFRIRKAFIAPPGYTLLAADEKALEIVILAHLLVVLFDDHTLANLVAPGAPDIHAVNARRVFGEFLHWEVRGRRVDQYPVELFQSDEWPELQQLRQDIKAVWYGLMYGKSAYGFATSLRDINGQPIGQEAAQKIIDALFAALPGLPRYQRFVANYVQEHHGIVGLGGAWCDLTGYIHEGEWGLRRAIRIGQNYPMQEGGARVIGLAMVGCSNDTYLAKSGTLLERQIHDELDFRIPVGVDLFKVKERINYHMTSYPLRSTLQVKMGTGTNWDDCKN